MVDINYDGVNDLDISVSKIDSWIKNVCKIELKKTGDVTLIFCSDDYLLEINQQHLNHDYFTDIVTFDYSVDDTISGDLFISSERVAENAALFGVPFLHELHRVIIHGVLHLCGYGDKLEEDAIIIRTKEDYALSLIGFT